MKIPCTLLLYVNFKNRNFLFNIFSLNKNKNQQKKTLSKFSELKPRLLCAVRQV